MRRDNRTHGALVENDGPDYDLDGDVLNSEQATKYNRCFVSTTTAKALLDVSKLRFAEGYFIREPDLGVRVQLDFVLAADALAQENDVPQLERRLLYFPRQEQAACCYVLPLCANCFRKTDSTLAHAACCQLNNSLAFVHADQQLCPAHLIVVAPERVEQKEPMEKDARCRYRRLGAVQAQIYLMGNTNTQPAWQTQDTYIVIALPTSHRKWIPSVRKRNSSSAEK
jgi:hypothetical protein